MIHKLTIQGELADLNSHIKAVNSNRYKGSNLKREETERVYMEAKAQKLTPVKDYPVHIVFTWHSKNLKKDIDNVAFAKKYILDGLVLAGVLKDDSRRYIQSFEDHFEIDEKNPKVLVAILS